MSHEKPLEELIGTLKQQRDEIALKIHLATAEAKQEWGKLEDKFQQLNSDYEPLRTAAGESAQKVGASLRQVARELLDSYARIRKSL